MTPPRRREKGVVVQQLPDELLIYDTETDRALCLNATAALVYTLCDGQTSPEGIAAQVKDKLGLAEAGPLVSLALSQLARARLLEGPSRGTARLLPRRRLLRQLGIAAALMPSVFSLVAPSALSAASGITSQGCVSVAHGSCPNQKCSDLPAIPSQTLCRRNSLPGAFPKCTCS